MDANMTLASSSTPVAMVNKRAHSQWAITLVELYSGADMTIRCGERVLWVMGGLKDT